MSRVFRVWGKKRGNRRTGSQLLGTVGEVAFSSALFMLGVVSLTALVLAQTLSASPPFPPGFGFWVLVLVLSSFVLLGGGGVVWTILHASVTRERRSALVGRAVHLDLRGSAEEADAPRVVFPVCPDVGNARVGTGLLGGPHMPVRVPLVER